MGEGERPLILWKARPGSLSAPGRIVASPYWQTSLPPPVVQALGTAEVNALRTEVLAFSSQPSRLPPAHPSSNDPNCVTIVSSSAIPGSSGQGKRVRRIEPRTSSVLNPCSNTNL